MQFGNKEIKRDFRSEGTRIRKFIEPERFGREGSKKSKRGCGYTEIEIT